MESWEQAISDAIEEFGRLKSLETEALSDLRRAEEGSDVQEIFRKRVYWFALKIRVEDKNRMVLELISRIPDSGSFINGLRPIA